MQCNAYTGAASDDIAYGQAGGGVGGGERAGGGGARVYEGHGLYQHVQEHERDTRLSHASRLRRH